MALVLPVIGAPTKPREGEACNGCGACCAAEVCLIGRKVFGEDVPAPCPGLTFEAGRYWCDLVVASAGSDAGDWLRMRLGVGVGCDSVFVEV
jgi:hypothetical protein